MIITKEHIIIFIVGAFLGLCTGFFTAKSIYDKPIEAKVERDTLIVHDTIPDYHPVVRDSTITKYITRYMRVTDTVTNTELVTFHDSVLVEVPITSKHYGADEYDAWVSGYEPSLDSIKVYRDTQYITETITLTKQPPRLNIGFQAGYGYGFRLKALEPYVGLGITYRF